MRDEQVRRVEDSGIEVFDEVEQRRFAAAQADIGGDEQRGDQAQSQL